MGATSRLNVGAKFSAIAMLHAGAVMAITAASRSKILHNVDVTMSPGAARGSAVILADNRIAGYTTGLLQRVSQVLQGESRQRPINATQPNHGFEALAHLAGQHQLPRLTGQPRELICVGTGDAAHFTIDA